jgi:hypothetical protein
MTDRVHTQLITVDFQNTANNQLLWDLTGDPMECHYGSGHQSVPRRP